MSKGSRFRKKLLEKTNWYRKRGSNNSDDEEQPKKPKAPKKHTNKPSKEPRKEQTILPSKEPGKEQNTKPLSPGSKSNKEPEKEQSKKHLPPKTVLFVEYTKGGELATRLRELSNRLAPILGFKIKIVERAGTPLRNSFPLNNLWEGMMCGRNVYLVHKELSCSPSVHNLHWCMKMCANPATREPLRKRSSHSLDQTSQLCM